ncbi:MAG: fumarylacetoacetate hydrolase family protein [Desulfobacterales bacterium]|nr:MAG: fumarylacetoacetate hydrolase family protein [Desulfobacterales bacterium]
MKFARFEVNGKIYNGMAEAEEVTVIKGSFWNDYEVTGQKYNISEVSFLPPGLPTKIVCVGQNYLGHIEELGLPVPKEPIIFFKPPSCLIGHEHPIIYPADAERVDYEGELAIVIKHKMKNVNETDALTFVLGYSCFNDVTERSMVGNNPFLLSLSKGVDTFGPCGPYIVTDLDPNRLMLKTFLNGELKQQDNTQNCVFSIQQVLSYISRYITLLPGDIVTTGTPKGIAPMQPGDTVEVAIEGIGCLRNRVGAQA